MNIILRGVCALLLVLPACGRATSDAAPDEAKQTVIAGFAFKPAELRVAVGDTVRWTNEDDIAHTVTSGRPKKQGVPGVTEDRPAAPDGTFDSGSLELDDTFDFVARSAGTYRYFCSIHAGMEARLVVR